MSTINLNKLGLPTDPRTKELIEEDYPAISLSNRMKMIQMQFAQRQNENRKNIDEAPKDLSSIKFSFDSVFNTLLGSIKRVITFSNASLGIQNIGYILQSYLQLVSMYNTYVVPNLASHELFRREIFERLDMLASATGQIINMLQRGNIIINDDITRQQIQGDIVSKLIGIFESIRRDALTRNLRPVSFGSDFPLPGQVRDYDAPDPPQPQPPQPQPPQPQPPQPQQPGMQGRPPDSQAEMDKLHKDFVREYMESEERAQRDADEKEQRENIRRPLFNHLSEKIERIPGGSPLFKSVERAIQHYLRDVLDKGMGYFTEHATIGDIKNLIQIVDNKIREYGRETGTDVSSLLDSKNDDVVLESKVPELPPRERRRRIPPMQPGEAVPVPTFSEAEIAADSQRWRDLPDGSPYMLMRPGFGPQQLFKNQQELMEYL